MYIYMYLCMKEVGEMQGVEVREREETESLGCGFDRIIISAGAQMASQCICSIYGVGICTQHFVSQVYSEELP